MKPNNPIIIAEVGVNHNGNLKLLNKLIDSVSKTGVNLLSFRLLSLINW